ncbi:MAG TPA: DinB family protein [Vicinamibacterales bacterium]
MQLTQVLLEELERETPRSRRMLEEMPEGKADWKPHEKSMTFGYLAELVAIMPSWITMVIKMPELDIAPKDGSRIPRTPLNTRADYLQALDKAVSDARAALSETDDAHLATNWRLLAGGRVAIETSRAEMIADTLNHWVHHRAQMTVYLRLLGAKVPALYGPSADERPFG